MLTRRFPVLSMYFHADWKTLWILIRWLHQKPADLDQKCFKKKVGINPGSTRQELTLYLPHRDAF